MLIITSMDCWVREGGGYYIVGLGITYSGSLGHPSS